MQEHFEEEEFSDEEDEDEYSDEEYSDSELEPVVRSGVPDFFNFGQNLTVKGGFIYNSDMVVLYVYGWLTDL